MARYTVKKTGKYGLIIFLRKRDGFKEGMEIEIFPSDRERTKQLTEARVKEMFEELIEEKRGF